MLPLVLLSILGLFIFILACVWQRKERAFWRELDSSFAIDSVIWPQEELHVEY